MATRPVKPGLVNAFSSSWLSFSGLLSRKNGAGPAFSVLQGAWLPSFRIISSAPLGGFLFQCRTWQIDPAVESSASLPNVCRRGFSFTNTLSLECPWMKPCVVSVSKCLGFDSFIPVHSVSVPVGLTIVTNRQRNIFAGTSVHLAKVASFCLLVGMRPAGYHMLAEQFVAAFSAMAVSLMAGNATNPIVFKQRSPCCIMSNHDVPAATVVFNNFRPPTFWLRAQPVPRPAYSAIPSPHPRWSVL